jgi:hypothetical protein
MKLRCAALAFATLAAAAFLTVPALASSPTTLAVVDQQFTSADASPNLWWSIEQLRPVGQEFTPQRAGLDAVSLWIAEGDGQPATMQVVIHDATISGAVLGTSAVAELPNNQSGEVRFDFSTLVRLTPGKRYVLEPTVLRGGNDGVYLATGLTKGTGYKGGRPIAFGVPIDEPSLETDMLFREGFASTIPRLQSYCVEDLFTLFTRTDATTFKNQGDCIQFTNTGR